MRSTKRGSLASVLAGLLMLGLALPAIAKPKVFPKSDDAKESDEPQKFLSNYDKLTEGNDTADWVYFPAGSPKTFKSVMVKEFVSNTEKDHSIEGKHAAEYGKDYLEKWLKKQEFNVVEKDGELVVEGNIFNAWEPSGAGRFWGGWMANPGVGMEIIAKDSSGKLVAEIRHKARGSTIKDAVENGLENVAEAMAKGK